MLILRKGRIISGNDKTSIHANVLDLGPNNNYIFFMGNYDNRINNNTITINGYFLVSIPRSGVFFENSGLIRKPVPGLYPWCKKYLDIFEDPKRNYRFEISKDKITNLIQYPSSLSLSLPVPITGNYNQMLDNDGEKIKKKEQSIPEKFHYSIMETIDKNGINGTQSKFEDVAYSGWQWTAQFDGDGRPRLGRGAVNKIIISNEGKTIIIREILTVPGEPIKDDYALYILYKNEDNKFIYVCNDWGQEEMKKWAESSSAPYINYNSINFIEKYMKKMFEKGDYFTLKIENEELLIKYGNKVNTKYKKLKTVPDKDIEGGIKIPKFYYNTIMRSAAIRTLDEMVSLDSSDAASRGLFLQNIRVNTPMLSLEMDDKPYYNYNSDSIDFGESNYENTCIIISSNGESIYVITDDDLLSQKDEGGEEKTWLPFMDDPEAGLVFNLIKTSDNKYKYVYQSSDLNQKDEFYFTFQLNEKSDLMIKPHLGPRYIPSGDIGGAVRAINKLDTPLSQRQWEWILPIGRQNLLNSKIKPPKNILGIHKMTMTSSKLFCAQEYTDENSNLIEWQPFFGLVPIETKYHLLENVGKELEKESLETWKPPFMSTPEDADRAMKEYPFVSSSGIRYKENIDVWKMDSNYCLYCDLAKTNKKIKVMREKDRGEFRYTGIKIPAKYHNKKMKYKNKLPSSNVITKIIEYLNYLISIAYYFETFGNYLDSDNSLKVSSEISAYKLGISEELYRSKLELKKKYEKLNIDYWKKQGINNKQEAEKKMLNTRDIGFFQIDSVCSANKDLPAFSLTSSFQGERCVDKAMSELRVSVLKKKEISMYEILITHLGVLGMDFLWNDIDDAPDKILLGDIFIKNINNMPWLIDNLIVSKDGKTITISNENKEYKYVLEDEYILGVAKDAGKKIKIGSKYCLQIDGNAHVVAPHKIFFRESKDLELVINFDDFIDMNPLGCILVGNNEDFEIDQNNKSWNGYNRDANKNGSKWGGQVLIMQ